MTGALKGGVGKTTTAMFLAAKLAQDGPTLLVDADRVSQSAFDWANLIVDQGGVLPFTVQPWSTNDLQRRVHAVIGDYQHLVIDTGGEDLNLFAAACRCVELVLVPIAANTIELRRVEATFVTARAVADEGYPLDASVLLNRVKTGTRDQDAARTLLEEADYPVLNAIIRDLVEYPRTYGYVPTFFDDVDLVLAELTATDEPTGTKVAA